MLGRRKAVSTRAPLRSLVAQGVLCQGQGTCHHEQTAPIATAAVAGRSARVICAQAAGATLRVVGNQLVVGEGDRTGRHVQSAARTTAAVALTVPPALAAEGAIAL